MTTTATPDARALARDLARRLRAAGRTEAQALAEWTVATVLGIGRAALCAGLAPSPSAAHLAELERIAGRLRAGEPLAYAIGWTEFLGRRFTVDRRVLIPRPETEELADLVLRTVLPRPADLDVWDVGTGSGVLAITIAVERPRVRVTATDLTAAAIEVARSNAEHHGVAERIRWRVADLMGPADAGVADVIVSNPPYVAAGEMTTLERTVREFEPRIALDGGPDGLAVIRRLIPAAARALRPNGWLCLEIGETQAPYVRTLLNEADFHEIRILRDLAGRDRFALAHR